MTTASLLLDPDDLVLSELLDDDDDDDEGFYFSAYTCTDATKPFTMTTISNEETAKPDAPASLVLDDNTSTTACSVSSSTSQAEDAPHKVAVVVTPDHSTKPHPSTTTVNRCSGGLSELSKQLRVLQAKNQQLQSQLERSERQLKILSDSKGVSVHELLASLESACAKEAFAEWQNKVRILEAQLEALVHGHGSSAYASGDGAAKMAQEKHAQQVAALELQLGEQEEVEQSLRKERDRLYQDLQEQKAATMTADAAREEQLRQLVQEQSKSEALEEKVKSLIQERDDLKARQAKMNREYWTEELYKQQQTLWLPMTERPTKDNNSSNRKPVRSVTPTRLAHKRTSPSTDASPWNSDCHNKHLSTVYQKQTERTVELELLCLQQQTQLKGLLEQVGALEKLQKKNQEDQTTKEDQQQALQQQASALELDVKLAQDEAESLRTQLSSRDTEHNLKKDQLQSRIKLHQDRIDDLEQQLSSLYVAFDLLQQDRSEEEQERHSLKTKLFQADEQMAKTLEKHQSPIQRRRPERFNVEAVQNTSALGDATPDNPVTPAFHKGKDDGASTTTPDTAMSTPPAAYESVADSEDKLAVNTVHRGYLFVQRDSIKHKTMRLLLGNHKDAWKKKYFVLKQGEAPLERGSLCLWYGEAPRAKVKGMIPHIIRGISTVGPLAQRFTTAPHHRNKAQQHQLVHEHGFVLHLNPRDANAPVIALAAASATERDEWMSVLQQTLGVKYQELSWAEQQLADKQVSIAVAKKYSLDL